MNITFSYLVTSFFTSYLASEQKLSDNTIASYSDCMKLLVKYVCKRFKIQTETINIRMITSELVLEFLTYMESERHNAPATRNQRLAAIKTFFHFLSRNVPELMHQNERIQAIKAKKTDHLPIPSLSVKEIAAILSIPDPATLFGARDKALLHLMYNTGARVQELADITLADLHLENLPSVSLMGKGRKLRVIPLWPETVEWVLHYLRVREQEGIEHNHLFLNIHGNPITRFGIGRRLEKHVKAAAVQCPSLQARRVSPHVIRHTTALHLIEADNDIEVVRDWLGHADIKTTCQYLEVSIERKRKALDKLPPPDGGAPPESPKWKQPNLMKFLTDCSRKDRYVA